MKELEKFMKQKEIEVALKHIKRILETGTKAQLIEYINDHEFIFDNKKV